jgi:hypothetical protein
VREVPDRGMRRVTVAPLMLLLLSIFVNIASAQIPARVETPYTLTDARAGRTSRGASRFPGGATAS